MKKLTSVCGIIALGMIAAACSGRETTTVRRETVQTAPAAPVVLERKITTETTETDGD